MAYRKKIYYGIFINYIALYTYTYTHTQQSIPEAYREDALEQQ